ncbi:hypothetical protein [Pseudomonas sp. Sample_16]|uniref:hypothetical protein n=1 Tax=Pseudomonas sp. Sample_16 TaxID=2448263 RepID=UPI001032E197|nr:hypothetical protein [Pseudomonas sp. Sample_16]
MNIVIRLQNFTGFAPDTLGPDDYVEVVFRDDGTWTQEDFSGFTWCPPSGVWSIALALETHMKQTAAGKALCILSDCNLKNPASLPDKGEFYWYREAPAETIGGYWIVQKEA